MMQTKPHSSVQHSARLISGKVDGFTMLEILLAMTVLVIIMLMMTTMFNQSATTWETGARETSQALTGRTILNLIAGDLEMAAMDDTLYEELLPRQTLSGDSISFYRYTEPGVTARAVKLVTYSRSGRSLTRTEQEITAPYTPGTSSDSKLVEDKLVGPALFSFPPGGPYQKTLPAWVDIRLELQEKSKAASDIEVWSVGQDEIEGTDDDIVE
jgi:prepilin-type N-terminal cleavage/methylation domain-containing protein